MKLSHLLKHEHFHPRVSHCDRQSFRFSSSSREAVKVWDLLQISRWVQASVASWSCETWNLMFVKRIIIRYFYISECSYIFYLEFCVVINEPLFWLVDWSLPGWSMLGGGGVACTVVTSQRSGRSWRLVQKFLQTVHVFIKHRNLTRHQKHENMIFTTRETSKEECWKTFKSLFQTHFISFNFVFTSAAAPVQQRNINIINISHAKFTV